MEGTSNKPINSNILKGASIITNTTGGGEIGDWVVHPAFNFGGIQLRGIWVAKFEASFEAGGTGGNNPALQVNVLPSLETNSVVSWRNIQAKNMYTVCKNMVNTGGALEELTDCDPHMMKNVEWGAVAYLTQSIYGQMREGGNNQVWVNPTGSYKTGQAGSGPNVEKTVDTNNYNTGNGPKASTTGNVYGIYDMSGGAFECVAAYLNNTEMQNSENIDTLRVGDSKYVDVYEIDSVIDPDSEKEEWEKGRANYSKLVNGNKILKWGDALYETSHSGYGKAAWQGDATYYSCSSRMLFQRGGYFDDKEGAGLFYYCYNSGNAHGNTSFRPVSI